MTRLWFLFLLWASAASAVTNSLTITEKAGTTTANYPIQIGRPFASGEISQYPQAILDGTPVSTQADVKTRWPNGSVKHAILTFYIPTLTANSTVTVTFQNQATGNNTSYLDTAGMLGAGYDFNAQMELTNGSTVTADARTMLTASAYTYWLQGSVATSIILADHSMSRAYDIGFDANKAFRPIFHATFWPTINKVRVRFIGEIANTEALEDQVYSLSLKTGNASPTEVYAKASFTHYTASRWTKEFWIGGTPSAITINHNLTYLSATTLIPNYDPNQHVSDASLASVYATWGGTAKDLYDAGFWTKNMGDTGGRQDLAPIPGWTIRWLYTGDSRAQEIALKQADLAAAWPLHIREGRSTENGSATLHWFDRAQTVDPIGRVLSTNARPTSWFLSSSSVRTQDLITPVGTVTNGGWGPENAHIPDAVSPQYLLTGDYWYLEELYFWSSWAANSRPGASVQYGYGRGPTGAEGGLSGGQVRSQAWCFRQYVVTAAFAPDADVEKEYFTTLVNDAIAIWEGQRNITTTSFYNTGNWKWGAATGQYKRWSDGQMLNCPATGCGMDDWWNNAPPTTLHPWSAGGTPWVNYECDPAKVTWALSPWEEHYVLTSLGRAKDLGFPINAVLAWVAPHEIGTITDPGSNPYYIANVRVPTISTATGTYFATWTDLSAALLPTIDPVGHFTASLTNGVAGYSIIPIAAIAYVADQPGGAAAWAWMNTNALIPSSVDDYPMWTIIPRTTRLAAPWLLR